MKKVLLVFLWVLFNVAHNAYAINVTTGYSPKQLVDYFVGSNIQISDGVSQYSDESIGMYSNACVEAQGNQDLLNGVVMSTGTVLGLNSNENTGMQTRINGLPRDPDLQGLIPADNYVGTYDATYLEFNFTPTATGTAYFTYMFGSEEYGYNFDPSNDRYTDVFGFFVNGENVALLSGTDTPMGVNTVNELCNPELYNDNTDCIYATEMNGFSVPLSAAFNVIAGQVYAFKLGISDANDLWGDSYVLLGGNSFNVVSNVPEPELWKNTVLVFVISIIVLFIHRKNMDS